MDGPRNADRKKSANTNSEGPNPRTTRRRRRTLLNLGIPFVQVDDFLNQAEDAVTVGYRVLEDTVKEIQKGYDQAKEFNQKQRDWDGKGPAPAIEWEKLVDSVQRFQDIALQAVRDGTDIMFDAVRSGTNSMRDVARTWEQSRADIDVKPTLAGPVFNEQIVITVSPGDSPDPVKERIRHRGLARLRIYAEMSPDLMELRPVGTDTSKSKTAKSRTAESGTAESETTESAPPAPKAPVVKSVTFKPASDRDDEDFSVLTVVLDPIDPHQKPAEYEGLIRAKNFELLIAKLKVRVVPADVSAPFRSRATQTPPSQTPRPPRTPPTSQAPTTPDRSATTGNEPGVKAYPVREDTKKA